MTDIKQPETNDTNCYGLNSDSYSSLYSITLAPYLLRVINGCLHGNAEAQSSADNVYQEQVNVAASVTARILVKTGSQQVYQSRSGPLITEQERKAQAKGRPIDSIEDTILQSNGQAFSKSSTFTCDGWSFEQVTTNDCRTCGTRGRVRCSGCGGTGKTFCTGCGGGGKTRRVVANTGTRTGSRVEYVTCYSCGGAGRCNCNSCGGSGSQSCNPCQGQGYIHTLHFKTYIAELSPTYQVDTAAVPRAASFVASNWEQLAERDHVTFSALRSRDLSAMAGTWDIDGQLTIDMLTAKIDRQTYEMTGSLHDTDAKASDIIWSSDKPFLGDVMDLPLVVNRRAVRETLAQITDSRMLRECQDVENGEGGSDKKRQSAAAEMLAKNYGDSLGASQRETIAKAALNAMNNERGRARRKGWLNFQPVMLLVASVLMWGADAIVRFDLLANMSIWLYRAGIPIEEPSSTAYLAAVILTALFIFVGRARVRKHIRRLGKTMGLSRDMEPKQGIWALLGPLLSMVTGAIGWLAGLCMMLILSTYTLFYENAWRNTFISDSIPIIVRTYLPVIATVSVSQRTEVFEGPGYSPMRPGRTVPKGAVVKILGTPHAGMSPVMLENNDIVWLRTLYLPGAPGRKKTIKTMQTTASLNLRKYSNTSGEPLITIPEGAVVTRLGYREREWEQVLYRGTIGWVSSDYLCCSAPFDEGQR